jgi:hypothetical protein
VSDMDDRDLWGDEDYENTDEGDDGEEEDP